MRLWNPKLFFSYYILLTPFFICSYNEYHIEEGAWAVAWKLVKLVHFTPSQQDIWERLISEFALHLSGAVKIIVIGLTFHVLSAVLTTLVKTTDKFRIGQLRAIKLSMVRVPFKTVPFSLFPATALVVSLTTMIAWTLNHIFIVLKISQSSIRCNILVIVFDQLRVYCCFKVSVIKIRRYIRCRLRELGFKY